MNSATSVIVHYGEPRPTVALANQLAGYGTDVVVVANDRSSRPDTLDRAVTWLIPDRNLGYGGAFRYAAQGRTTPALVLLNNDIVLPRETFEYCVDRLLAEPGAGIVAPVLRHEDNTLQSGAARLSRWRRAPEVKIDPGPTTVDCTWVTGAVMFMRREVAEHVGIDGSYFLGAEDTDLCLRAQCAGWRILCCGAAVATHHGARVIGVRWNYYATRNRIWYTRVRFGFGTALLNWVYSVAMLPRVVLADVVKGRGMMSSRLTLLGLVHAWRRKPPAEAGPLPGEPFPDRLLRAGGTPGR